MKNKKIENITYLLYCLIIFSNIIQIGLSGFDISFNYYLVQITSTILILILNRFKIKNHILLMTLIVFVIIFLFNYIFNNSQVLTKDINAFFVYVFPIIIVFLHKLDFNKLSAFFLYFSVGCSWLYLLNLINNTPILSDYMTFGYYGMFCSTYIFIYSVIYKKNFLMIYAFIISMIFFTFGSRGSVLLILIAILLLTIFSEKRGIKKFLILILLVTVILLGKNLAIYILNALNDLLGNSAYSIRNILKVIESNSISEQLGGRYLIYEQAWNEFLNNPLFGMGLSSFQNKYGYFIHNIFLDVFTSFGVIFGMAYFAYLFVISKKSIKEMHNLNIKIFVIFAISISTKLLFSKTFIYDSFIWLLICIMTSICISKKEGDLN